MDTRNFRSGSTGSATFLPQRFTRHANPITTVIYTHRADEEIYSAIAQT